MTAPSGDILLVTLGAATADLARLLEATGHPVRSVVCDGETFDAIERCEPALVVLDVAPDGTALLDLARRLASKLGAAAPAVLAIIDSQDGALIERAFTEGVRDVVARPVSAPLLRAVVQKHARRTGPGTHAIGGYSIQRALGKGGMGVVYLVERDGQRYALKVLDVAATADMEALARFRREMDMLRSLRGPGIPRFFEAGRTEDCFFYVMEYFEGETLSALVQRGPLDEPTVRTMIGDIASALAVMHAAGLVHRDVKPGNVILMPSKHATLIDYGLAKFLDDFSLTRADEVLGTMLYIAPEVLSGDGARPPADAFSLGMTALHAALGKDPMDGTAAFLARRILRGDLPRARDLLPRFSRGTVDVIDGLLEFDPLKRLSVSEARRRLEPGEVEGQTVVSPRRAPSLVLTLAFLDGESAGRTHEFESPRRVVLGRSKDVDVEIFDPRVSRRHCTIALEPTNAQLKDLGSSNGTFVNGSPVKLALLQDGDVLKIADTQLRVGLAERSRTEQASASGTPAPGVNLDGVSIPGYELLARLGSGSSGVVFEARSQRTGELVAVKVSRPKLDAGSHEQARLLREAATASVLVHPNIVRVIERGEHEGAFYLVMELVKGETLRSHVQRKGPLAVPFALNVARQIASALELARTCGIVHRDVKPENILLQEDGTAKLADFGIAKAPFSAGTTNLTRAGDLLGTLPYIAPEQIRAAPLVDHRADVYSLGATLFFMLAARAPFESASPKADIMERILAEEAPLLATVREDVPPIVAKLVASCLKKDPLERPQKASDLVRQCDNLLAAVKDRSTVSG
jgi:serine/threonine-protein kinase